MCYLVVLGFGCRVVCICLMLACRTCERGSMVVCWALVALCLILVFLCGVLCLCVFVCVSHCAITVSWMWLLLFVYLLLGVRFG